jgi:hypothetical protein
MLALLKSMVLSDSFYAVPRETHNDSKEVASQ